MQVTSYPLIFLALSATPSYQWNANFIYNVIEASTRGIGTQDLLMFYCARCQDERLDHLVGRISHNVGIPQYVTTNYTNYKLRAVTKRNYWALVFAKSTDDFIFQVHDWTLVGFHYYFGMVVFLEPVDDLEVIRRFLFYLYKKRFVNTHVYFACSNLTDNVYGFLTYPRFEIKNRIKWVPNLSAVLLLYLNRGVVGYAFRTPLKLDVPGVFKFKNRAGKVVIQGTSYRIFEAFVRHVNGSIVEYPMNTSTNSVNMQEVLQLIEKDKIEISVHAYALYKKFNIDQSYPLTVVKYCLMVPSFNRITNNFYLIKPFEVRVWLLYLLASLSFILISYAYEHFILREDNLSSCILIGICLMLNIAAPKIFKDPSIWRFFILSIVFFNAAVVTIFYTSFLGSILTVNPFRQQINTIDDLISAKLPVMMLDFEYQFLRNISAISEEFEKLVFIVDPDTLSSHRDMMNTSFAYLSTDDGWHFIALQQKYLKLPRFRLSDICFGSFHMGFPMQMDSPVWRHLEYFIYRVHSSGLYQYFESVAFDYAVLGGYARRLASLDGYQSAGMTHLLMAFELLATLCVISLAIFTCEVVVGRRRRNKK